MSKTRGIRGATTVESDSPELIRQATKELLFEMEKNNLLVVDEISAVLFSATKDLHSAYPAAAAREIGWTTVPLLCFQEMAVDNSVSRCIRILILYNTDARPKEINHVYLRGARVLRPDLAGGIPDEPI